MVLEGLTAGGVGWALTHAQASNWHPLTTISHMADCQWFGLNAGRHHLVNVALHAATAVALFLVLRAMTGALWPSAFVAAVFAAHPLRAESVAWISERKDVLSGLFFMLTVGAYAKSTKAQGPRHKLYYALVVIFFALGLMTKPMLVTLPVVLLAMDYWPLRRIEGCVHLRQGAGCPNRKETRKAQFASGQDSRNRGFSRVWTFLRLAEPRSGDLGNTPRGCGGEGLGGFRRPSRDGMRLGGFSRDFVPG
jgi:hypothetical protein